MKKGEGKLINHEELSRLIVKVEAIITAESLDMYEQKLLYDILLQRYNDKVTKTKMQDSIGDVSIGGLFNKIKKVNLGGKSELDY